MATNQPSPAPQPPTCPWCPYTDAVLKKVMTHMASQHPQRWGDLARYAPISGDEPG